MTKPGALKIGHVNKANPCRVHILSSLIALLCVQVLLITGCATTSYPVLGIRPDHPNLLPSEDVKKLCGVTDPKSTETFKASKDPKIKENLMNDCMQYYNYLEYGRSLSGAYRSRATLNEWGLYFAALVGLTGLTATAGLAAANAGIQALRIVPLVSGFVSGASTLLHNREKAASYTEAANRIDTAIVIAEQKVILNRDYANAAGHLIREVNEARNDLENVRVELAVRDKQTKEIADKIRESLPKPLRLSEEDIDIPLGTPFPMKVEDGDSVDPGRTTNSKAGVVDLTYSANGQLITITGRKPGQTTIKFRNKQGISAAVNVDVLPTTSVSGSEVKAGTKTVTLEEGQKQAYLLPNETTGDDVQSSDSNIALGRLFGAGKFIIIEAVNASSSGGIVTVFKQQKEVMTMTITVTVKPVAAPSDPKKP
jgi:hypothetical protein